MRILTQWLAGPIQSALENVFAVVVRGLLKSVVKAMLGATLAIFGIALLAIGVIKYLTQLLQNPWIAWLVVGTVLALVGTAIFFSSMPSRK